MQRAQPTTKRLRYIRPAEIDATLPPWARRTNPIIRRELGQFWKRLLPDFPLLTRLIAVQVGLLLLLPASVIMTLTLPIAMLAVVIVPALLFMYARLLAIIVIRTATVIIQDRERHMLDLLRVSPLPLTHITWGKVAAALWHRIEELDIVLIGTVIFGLPLVVIAHMGSEVTNVGYQLPQRLLAVLVLTGLPLRLLLEPIFFASVALLAGLMLPTRTVAITTTLAGMVFYYALVTIPVFANVPWAGRLLIDVIVPLMVPALGTIGCMWLAHYRIQQA